MHKNWDFRNFLPQPKINENFQQNGVFESFCPKTKLIKILNFWNFRLKSKFKIFTEIEIFDHFDCKQNSSKILTDIEIVEIFDRIFRNFDRKQDFSKFSTEIEIFRKILNKIPIFEIFDRNRNFF